MSDRLSILQELFDESACRYKDARRTARVELVLMRSLKERIAAEAESKRSESQRPASVSPVAQVSRPIGGKDSLPSLIVSVMREHPELVGPNDIAKELARRGVTTKAKRGLMPNVITSLMRRDDLFRRVGRGQYALTPAAANQNGKERA